MKLKPYESLLSQVYDSAMDYVIANASFSDAACSDYTSGATGVTVTSEITLPLAIIAHN